MESNQFSSKLAKWAFILQEYIFILFIGLVGLIRMPMGWVGTQVLVKRIPHVPSGMERWIWKLY
jgi:hypothetical protein